MNHMKKNLILSAIGVGLQTAGGICLFVAALGIGKEINQQIRNTIIKELSKQVVEEKSGPPAKPAVLTSECQRTPVFIKRKQGFFDTLLRILRFNEESSGDYGYVSSMKLQKIHISHIAVEMFLSIRSALL